jgi:hypothetical protein
VTHSLITGLEHQFPPKKIGKLNAEQTARRAGQLEAFLQELLDTILSANVKSALLEFLEIKEDMRTSTPPALASSMSPAPPPPPIESLGEQTMITLLGACTSTRLVLTVVSDGDICCSHQLTVPIMVEEPPPKPASCWSNDFMSSDPLAQLTLDPPSEKPKPKPQKDASPPRPVRLPTQHDITCIHTTARAYAAVCIGRSTQYRCLFGAGSG